MQAKVIAMKHVKKTKISHKQTSTMNQTINKEILQKASQPFTSLKEKERQYIHWLWWELRHGRWWNRGQSKQHKKPEIIVVSYPVTEGR